MITIQPSVRAFLTMAGCFLGILAMMPRALGGDGATLPLKGTGATGRPAGRMPGHPSLESPQTSPIVLAGGLLYVVNTPAGTVDVIDPKKEKITSRIPVGVDPVCVAARPDGKEVWVANHVSDSVSVIDSDPASPTHHRVIATIQDFDPRTRATRFDEPVGIAFAGNGKAYVALSSENQIAVIDTTTRSITRRLKIPAQDPRAIVVRGERLYVIPFESNNQTQLSGGSGDKIDGGLVTFDAYKHSIQNNNVLSLGHVVDIVKNPRVPDRDLFVFDTKTDEPVATVSGLGTLLYGLAVDSGGQVFIAQTDARNDVNGRSGSKKHGLAELQNRAFLNRITRVKFQGGEALSPSFIDLEPPPPAQPKRERTLATPFAIEVSSDDRTLVATAAASDRLFMVDSATGALLGQVQVGSGPRGIALETIPGGGNRAWVLNALANTVSVVDISDREKPHVTGTIALEDPTHPVFKKGRIAFNTAAASTTATFSCASCHPDGHTDQLLWVLDTPVVTGGNQIMPRSTMPVRGLRDTAPFHWDGIPGDPYGGINSASIHKPVAPNSKPDQASSATRHLTDGGLGSTMHLVGDTRVNDEGKAGELSGAERDAMAVYLLGVPYPPAQRRSYTDELTKAARDGFRLFHIDGDHDPKQATPNVCGNCHRMPFLVSTNTPGTGMDTPTWRGAYDRWLILPQGRLNIIDFDFFRRVAEQGTPERSVWQFSWSGRQRFDPVWDMVLEMSTGFPGAFARQATLTKDSVDQETTLDLLNALEKAAREGMVVLEGDGCLVEGKKSSGIKLRYIPGKKDGTYQVLQNERNNTDRENYTRKELIGLVKSGNFIGTFTAKMGERVTVDDPQPAIWTLSPIEKQSGRQIFPILHTGMKTMEINGRHFDSTAKIFVDGNLTAGSVEKKAGESFGITLNELPAPGLHFLQVQVPEGMLSNEFLFHVAKDGAAAGNLRRSIDRPHLEAQDALIAAIAAGDLAEIEKMISGKAKVNGSAKAGGATPLGTAAAHGRLEIARLLLGKGAEISGTNRDGNTALHLAAFFGRTDMVKLLLEKGAKPDVRNKNGKTALDLASSPWTQELESFLTLAGKSMGMELDLAMVQRGRLEIATILGSKKGV